MRRTPRVSQSPRCGTSVVREPSTTARKKKCYVRVFSYYRKNTEKCSLFPKRAEEAQKAALSQKPHFWQKRQKSRNRARTPLLAKLRVFAGNAEKTGVIATRTCNTGHARVTGAAVERAPLASAFDSKTAPEYRPANFRKNAKTGDFCDFSQKRAMRRMRVLPIPIPVSRTHFLHFSKRPLAFRPGLV